MEQYLQALRGREDVSEEVIVELEDTKGKTLSDFVDLLKLLGVNTNYELLTIENYQNLTTIDPNKTYFIKEEQI